MRFVPRLLGDRLEKAARQFPALIVTGPRRAGKTTYRLSRFVVHRPPGETVRLSALRPGVQAGDLEGLLALIGR